MQNRLIHEPIIRSSRIKLVYVTTERLYFRLNKINFSSFCRLKKKKKKPAPTDTGIVFVSY